MCERNRDRETDRQTETEINRVFDDFMDEFAVRSRVNIITHNRENSSDFHPTTLQVFAYQLTAAEISKQFSYIPKTDRLLVPEGFAALMPWDDNCGAAAAAAPSSLLAWESLDSTLEALREVDVIGNMDSVAMLDEGLYQICFTKSPSGTPAGNM